MAAYEDVPLLPAAAGDESKINIRLVNLPPGEKTGQVTCTMIECPLSQPLEYEAVSYCWGNKNDTAQILCDGRTLAVPSNLNDFLLRTRAEGQDRTLWIDSICIDQTNKPEKDSQMAAMRHIYRKAKRTLIWLGKEYDQSTIGLEFAGKLCTAFKDIATQKKAKWYELFTYSELSAVFGFGQDWVAFFKLFDRPWFTRAWIVQEVVVSTQAWIVCGEKTIYWPDLVTAMCHVVLHQTWVFEFYGSKNLNNLLCLQLSQLEVSQGLERTYYEVLARHRQSISTEPQDSIFAFYGISCYASLKEHLIAPSDEPSDEPSDKPSIETLFTRLAISTLRKASDLDFLGIPRLRRGSKGGLRLPSWVPDWSCHDPISFSLQGLEIRHSMLENDRPTYAATGTSSYKPIIDEGRLRLEVSGYIIDRISSVSEPWIMQETSGFQSIRKQALVLQQNQKFIDDWGTVLEVDSRSAYHTGENMRDVLWQVCTARRFDDGDSEETVQKAFHRFEKRQKYLRAIRKLHLHHFLWVWMAVVMVGHLLRFFGIENPEMAFRTKVAGMINRQAMKTSQRSVGMVPGIAKVDNVIVLLKGGRLPFVVRQRGEEWELIGDCYVHGITNGEAWEENKCEKMWLV